MDLQAAITLAEQRMKEMSIPPGGYHYKAEQVAGTVFERVAGIITRTAYNEIYILVNHENISGLEISGDMGYFSTANPGENTGFEFTGLITIKKTAVEWSISTSSISTFFPYPVYPPPLPVIRPLEFLRVIIH